MKLDIADTRLRALESAACRVDWRLTYYWLHTNSFGAVMRLHLRTAQASALEPVCLYTKYCSARL
jgi:hypothetical protein